MNKFDWRQNKIAIAALTVAVIAALFAAGVYLRSTPKRIVVTVDPPDREEITTFGAIRYVFGPDGKTVVEKHIPYAGGGEGHQYFRADGTLRETTEDYPVRQGSTEVVLKARGTWSADGKTLELGQAYRPNGSLWFTLKDLGGETLEETIYFADGWKFSTAVRKKGESLRKTTYFHRNGNVWAEEIHEKTQWNSYNEKNLIVFDASGKRKLFKIDQVGWNQTVDGFSAGNSSGRLVTFYNDAGKPAYRQWCNTWWNWHIQLQGNLLAVHILDETTGHMVKTIEVDESGDTTKLKAVSFPSGARKVFRDSGSLRKVSIEKLTVQGQPRERFFVQGTCTYELDAQGLRTDHADSERLYETIDLLHLSRPAELELKESRTQAQAENRSVLGPRDDSDPVKWYHRQ